MRMFRVIRNVLWICYVFGLQVQGKVFGQLFSTAANGAMTHGPIFICLILRTHEANAGPQGHARDNAKDRSTFQGF
jgi:hypothetical protein